MKVSRKITVAALLLAAAAPALASTSASTRVHACRGVDGAVAYQDAPCARSQRLLREWIAPPDPVVPRPPRQRARESAPQRSLRTPSVRGARVAKSSDPCREARERRDATERRVGLARTYELLSALQREVYDACR